MPRQLSGGATPGTGQRMLARHVHRQFAVVGQRPGHQAIWIVFLPWQQTERGASVAHQFQHVLALRIQPFQFDLREGLGEALQDPLFGIKLVDIGEHHGQSRFDRCSQAHAQLLEARIGGQDLLRVAKYLSPGLGQLRVAPAAIEQTHAQVGFQVGNGGTDCRLGLAQASRRSRERAQRRSFHEGLQGFGGVGH